MEGTPACIQKKKKKKKKKKKNLKINKKTLMLD